MKKIVQILILALTGVVATNTAQAQTYDPLAVQRINNLIANNGLQATPNAPETWMFAFWNDETPKQLTRLDVENRSLTGAASFAGLTNLQRLHCFQNNLTKLDLTGCTALQDLQCGYNKLTELDVSTLTNLQILICSRNNLTILDVTNCTQLQGFICSGNSLNKLGVPISLLDLACYENSLTELDITSCTQLRLLRCAQNSLTTLDLSKMVHYPLFDAREQNVPLTLHKGVEEYTCPISLNNPTFGNSAISYSEEILKSTDSTVSSTSFSVQTGKSGYELSGTMHLSYSIVGIEDPENIQLKIYPNPTTGELRIENYELEIKSVEVFDIYGRKCHASRVACYSSPVTLNISHLQAGTYLIKINTEAGTKTLKVIKH